MSSPRPPREKWITNQKRMIRVWNKLSYKDEKLKPLMHQKQYDVIHMIKVQCKRTTKIISKIVMMNRWRMQKKKRDNVASMFEGLPIDMVLPCVCKHLSARQILKLFSIYPRVAQKASLYNITVDDAIGYSHVPCSRKYIRWCVQHSHLHCLLKNVYGPKTRSQIVNIRQTNNQSQSLYICNQLNHHQPTICCARETCQRISNDEKLVKFICISSIVNIRDDYVRLYLNLIYAANDHELLERLCQHNPPIELDYCEIWFCVIFDGGSKCMDVLGRYVFQDHELIGSRLQPSYVFKSRIFEPVRDIFSCCVVYGSSIERKIQMFNSLFRMYKCKHHVPWFIARVCIAYDQLDLLQHITTRTYVDQVTHRCVQILEPHVSDFPSTGVGIVNYFDNSLLRKNLMIWCMMNSNRHLSDFIKTNILQRFASGEAFRFLSENDFSRKSPMHVSIVQTLIPLLDDVDQKCLTTFHGCFVTRNGRLVLDSCDSLLN